MRNSGIRQLIREMLLTEAAYTPEMAASSQLFFRATKRRWGGGGWDISCEKKGHENYVGELSIALPLGVGRCLGAYEVTKSDVAIDGLGPLLYDIAMELAGPAGLMSDRRMVSYDARRVWQYYLDRRPDVDNEPLDSRPGTVTPYDDRDDCDQSSARDGGRDWKTSPLSKVYRKNGTPIIDRLTALGIIDIT